MSRSFRWTVSEPPSSEDLDPYPATTRPTPPTTPTPSIMKSPFWSQRQAISQKRCSLQSTCLLCNAPDQGIVADKVPVRSSQPTAMLYAHSRVLPLPSNGYVLDMMHTSPHGTPRASSLFAHEASSTFTVQGCGSSRPPQMCMGVVRVTVWQSRRSGVVRKLLTVCLCGCCPGRLV